MQLYSLRDTGINGMLKAGIDPLSVMQAADHSDLSMTTRYANHAAPELFRKLNEKAPSFRGALSQCSLSDYCLRKGIGKRESVRPQARRLRP